MDIMIKVMGGALAGALVGYCLDLLVWKMMDIRDLRLRRQGWPLPFDRIFNRKYCYVGFLTGTNLACLLFFNLTMPAFIVAILVPLAFLLIGVFIEISNALADFPTARCQTNRK